jgi:hypothetical protein
VSPSNPGVASENLQLDQGLTSGTIKGIDYSYGTREFTASGNTTREETGYVQETLNETTVRTLDLPLITNWTHVETYNHLLIKDYDEVTNTTNKIDTYLRNQDLSDYWDLVYGVIPLYFNSTDGGDGLAQMNIQITENATIANAVVVSTEDEFLGQFATGTTRVTFNYKDNATAPVIQRSMLIIPEVLILELTTEVTTVEVTHQQVSFASMGYYMRYSNEYNVTATAHQVNITDGENFGVGVAMFDSIEANYTEAVVSAIWYAFFYADVYTLKYTNGTEVDGGMYPRSMLPILANSNGTMVEAGLRHSSTTMKSTFQSVVAAFASLSADVGTDQATIEGNLAVWGLQTMTTMAAYRDGNRNDKLDLRLDRNGIQVASSDRVEYLGLTEAYQTTTVNAYYSSHNYNETVNFAGMGVKVENLDQNDTYFNVEVEQYGYGDYNTNIDSQFYWETPVENSDGSVTFEFGVNYNDFPVTWINTYNETRSFIDYEDWI